MRIFFQDVHATLTQSFATVLNSFGATLLLGDTSFSSVIKIGALHDSDSAAQYGPNVRSIGIEEFFENPPDILLVSCENVQSDIQKKLWPGVKNKSTLVIYEGNGYRIHGYDGIDAVVTADIKTYRITAAEKKNVLLFFPPFDRSLFSWQGYSEEQTLGCYIIRYRENFPNDAYLADIIAQRAAGMRIKTIFNKDVRHERLTDLFKKSMATLHIKSLEGYGFSIIESLACGRPVILHEPFSAGKTYRFWCREGESALYFNSLEECMAKITRLSLDAEFRHELQRKSADTVMRMIDFQEQAENLRNFFEMIASVKTGKGKRPFSYAAPPYPEYVPSLSEKIEVLNLYSDIAAKAIKRKSGAASVLIHTGARFIKRYIVKGGFLKGYEGLKESVLNAFAVFLKYAKNKERTN